MAHGLTLVVIVVIVQQRRDQNGTWVFTRMKVKRASRVQYLVFGIKIVGGNFGCRIYDGGVLRFRFVNGIHGVRYGR